MAAAPSPLPMRLPVGTRTTSGFVARNSPDLRGTLYWAIWDKGGNNVDHERSAASGSIDWSTVTIDQCAACGSPSGASTKLSSDWPEDVVDAQVCMACVELGRDGVIDAIRERRAKQPKPAAVRPQCVGETCALCGKQSEQKVAEEFQVDEPNPNRHPLTAYLCQEDFNKIFGE